VKIGEEVWLTCLSHALTTETEEVMGLLLGDVEGRSDRRDMGGVAADEVRAEEGPRRGQPRAARRRDGASRDILFPLAFLFFEILLVLCGVMFGFFGGLGLNSFSHKMTATIKKTTRVIGWYHSHPHITVLPSHVGKLSTFPPLLKHFVPRVSHLHSNELKCSLVTLFWYLFVS